MKHMTSSSFKWTLAAVSAMFIAGCASFYGNSRHYASSMTDYLYPKDYQHVDAPGVPVLSLPLKVGIAFVPEGGARVSDNRVFYAGNAQFSEERKMKLARDISDNFKKYPFVKTIELIPSAYLTPNGSFANLEQIRSMFGVDVVALLAYDQMQFTDQGLLSLTYLTIVGAYTIPGERNDTRTMMEATVYDIASRKLLFRAPGTSQIKASSTPINMSEKLRQDSEHGFDQAATNLVANLQVQLESFKERVKSSPEEFKVIKTAGYTGGSSLGLFETLLAAGLGIFCLWPRKTNC